MKIALFQMQMSACMEENQKKSLEALKEAAENGAQLILFPELQCCPFFPQYEKQDAGAYRMGRAHPFVRQLQEACREHRIMAAPNIYLQEDGKCYDATLLINAEGSLLGLQKMVHIAQAEGFYEQDYYTPAEEGFRVFETELGRLGIVVCFDRHYPESIRTEALMGADLILIPTANTVSEPSELFEWELRVQAFQNSVAIAMCNRVGREGEMQFSGESLLVSPEGKRIGKAGAGEELFYAELEPKRSCMIRGQKNYTALRRTELYL